MEDFSFDLDPICQDGDGGAVLFNNIQRMREKFVAGYANEFILIVKYTCDIQMKDVMMKENMKFWQCICTLGLTP